MKFNPESIQWMVIKMVSSASASWVNPNGNRNFPYVNDNGEAWNPNFNWTDNDFNDDWRWLVEVSDTCSFPAIMWGFFFPKHVSAIHRASFQSRQFDFFVKHTLREKYYIRYCDDFVALSHKKPLLECYKFLMKNFLSKHLKLDLHTGKVSIHTVSSGVDFFGWVHCPNHRHLRTTTKRRIMKGMKRSPRDETLQSYLGLLKHGATHKLRKEVLKVYLLNRPE